MNASDFAYHNSLAFRVISAIFDRRGWGSQLQKALGHLLILADSYQTSNHCVNDERSDDFGFVCLVASFVSPM